jgi:hypothetical protein
LSSRSTTTPGEPVQPKHPIETNAFLVYRGQSVYAALEENDVLDRIARFLTFAVSRQMKPSTLRRPSQEESPSGAMSTRRSGLLAW